MKKLLLVVLFCVMADFIHAEFKFSSTQEAASFVQNWYSREYTAPYEINNASSIEYLDGWLSGGIEILGMVNDAIDYLVTSGDISKNQGESDKKECAMIFYELAILAAQRAIVLLKRL
jgi:hypothetical protein